MACEWDKLNIADTAERYQNDLFKILQTWKLECGCVCRRRFLFRNDLQRLIGKCLNLVFMHTSS